MMPRALALAALTLLGPFLAAGSPAPVSSQVSAADPILPQSRWEYPQLLGFRPGDGAAATVNPPRFSWAYDPALVPVGRTMPERRFTLQIASDPGFASPEVEVRDTPWNFFNALAPLPPGTWYWRVGYRLASEAARAPSAAPTSWSETRRFTVAASTQVWDRSGLADIPRDIARLPRPRLGPPRGDWASWHAALRADPVKSVWLGRLIAEADQIVAGAAWKNFPANDSGPRTKETSNRFANLAKNVAVVGFAHKLTGDRRYADAIRHALVLARYPKGGPSAPEALGGQTKMTSQIVEFLAHLYDWYHADLRPAERATLLAAIEWRLNDAFFHHPDARNWLRGDGTVQVTGLAVAPTSHVYQNWAWSVPAIALTVGDLPRSAELLELSLHYLAGVTIPEGPDEGFNEGGGYSGEKTGTMLRAAELLQLLAPGLAFERNPMLTDLGLWFTHMYPPGNDRLSFGDEWAPPASRPELGPLHRIARLTGDRRLAQAWRERARSADEPYERGLYGRPWMQFLLPSGLPASTPSDALPRHIVLPEAGWVFVNALPPSPAHASHNIGMIFQARPRGGYSHSYASDGSFVWYGGGQTLSAGGGLRKIADTYAHQTIAHNSLLIDGVGQTRVNPRSPQAPYAARLLAWHEQPGLVWWSSDLTGAYLARPDLRRVHRHVAFVADRWFVIFDDLAMADEAEPARFSWLFKVAPETDLVAKDETVAYSLGGVRARVVFPGQGESIELRQQRGREGFVNLITGEDHLPALERSHAGWNMREQNPIVPMAHHVWATNHEPTRAHVFLAVLASAAGTADLPRVERIGPAAVALTGEDGRRVTVSFDPATPADHVIPTPRIRDHAERTLVRDRTSPTAAPPPLPSLETVQE